MPYHYWQANFCLLQYLSPNVWTLIMPTSSFSFALCPVYFQEGFEMVSDVQ
jgi:hypothetical protein